MTTASSRLEKLVAHCHCSAAAAAAATDATDAADPSRDLNTVYSAEELAKHASKQSCWVALRGLVYDFTPFVELHPGGARALLRHAGADATAVFEELHSESIFDEFATPHLIGKLAGAPATTSALPTKTAAAAAAVGPVEPATLVAIGSPFPHQRFDGTGLEAARFVLADASRLVGGGLLAAGLKPHRSQANHVHRQKSNLSVLHTKRDWLHIGPPAVYAKDMNMKRRLILEQPAMTYVGNAAAQPETLEAEAVVLRMVI
eukprot:SAG11_NODE_8443_length_1015_cov_1.362445_1_plen_259_part_01